MHLASTSGFERNVMPSMDGPGRFVTLSTLVRDSPGARLIHGADDVDVRGVSQDVGSIRPGWLYVAIPGWERSGTEHIGAAIDAGATAVALESADPVAHNLPVIRVPYAQAALADFAAAWHGHPSRSLVVSGVTGTDGKTTTTQLLGGILSAHGWRIGWSTSESVRVGSQIRAK